MSLGSRIKEQRERLGMTRPELAEAIGVTSAAIGNYETGYSVPKIELLYKIFDALQCDANYLYQDDMGTAPQTAVTDDEQTLLSRYRRLNQNNKDLLLKTAQYLIDSEEMETLLEKVRASQAEEKEA